jgi:hypothetical protein
MNQEGISKQTFSIIMIVVFIMAIYGGWSLYKRSDHIETKQLTISQGRIITEAKKEIEHLNFTLRWETLLGILLDKDRQIEFDIIEEKLSRKILDGLIRTEDEDGTRSRITPDKSG